MRKIKSLAVVIFLPLAVNAQALGTDGINKAVFDICATIFVAVIALIFIISTLKQILDYRIKKKIIENGIPEHVASSILRTNPREDRNGNIKWFAILAGIGLGLIIVNNSLPLGIHSLAIMAFSTALSFLGYFFFIKHSEK